MSTRKSMTFPIILTLIIILIIIYLFTSLKQEQITCNKTKTFDSDVRLVEEVIATTDGKKIKSMNITKTIILPDKYNNEEELNGIKNALDNTLEYLGDKVTYTITDNRLIVNIKVNKDEIILLNNIEFVDNGDLQIKINSNTKSSDVITLSVGDNYTDGEFMKHMKNNGYNCK